jgi:hypothetical protein
VNGEVMDAEMREQPGRRYVGGLSKVTATCRA